MMKIILCLLVALVFSGCKEQFGGFRDLGPKIGDINASGNAYTSNTPSTCDNITAKTCADYQAANNCTGAKQQYACNIGNLDADKDGYVCDEEFKDVAGNPTCKVK